MPTDEMIANNRSALLRERRGYEIKLAGAETAEDKAKWKDRLSSVDDSLNALGGSSAPRASITKAELLSAAVSAGVDADKSMTKAEILEVLDGSE